MNSIFCPKALNTARYLLTSWAFGRGGKFSDELIKKKFDN
jgi:hypothetical protein